MSQENVKRFYEALAKDEALQAKFKALGKKYEGQKPDEAEADRIFQDDVVPMARAAGFDFSVDEVKAYAEQARKPETRELSQEELAAVAGGVCYCFVAGGGSVNGRGCACLVLGGGRYGNKSPCFCFMGGSGS